MHLRTIDKLNLLLALSVICITIFPSISLASDEECLTNLASPPYRIDTVDEYLKAWHSEVSHFFYNSTKKNFDSVFRSASKKNQKSLSLLFKSSPNYDGAGAEDFSYAMLVLMLSVGDETFSNTLKLQPKLIKQRVIDYIDYATPYDYSNSHPKTFALGKHRPTCE